MPISHVCLIIGRKNLKTLKEYSSLINKNLESPLELRKVELELAADYAYYMAELIPLKAEKAQAWINIKHSDPGEGGRLISDRLAEMRWRMTSDGAMEHAISLKLRAIEKMISSIKDAMYISSQAIRNEI